MAYTDQQIRELALKLEQKGAPPEEIEAFVASAVRERQPAAGQSAPQQESGISRFMAMPTGGLMSANPVLGSSVPNGGMMDAVKNVLMFTRDKRQGFQEPSSSAMPSALTGMSEAGTGGLTPEEAIAGTRMAATTASRMAPVAAAIAFPPSTIGNFATLGAVGAGGEALARFMEGKDVMSREGAAEMAKAGALSATPAPALGAARGGISAAVQGAKAAGAAAGTELGAETLRRSIEEGKLATYNNLSEAWRDLRIVGGVGLGLGAAGARLGGYAEKGAELAARKALLDEIGAKNPTLAMQHPSTAGWEVNIAQRNPALAERIASAKSDITKEFYTRIGDLTGTGNPEIAQKMQALIPQADEAEHAYKLASKQAEDARAALLKAEQAVDLPPAQKAQIQAEATLALTNAVNAEAAAAMRANAQLGDAVTNTAKARELANVFNNLIDARSAISKQLYEAAGINPAEALFSKESMLAMAAERLGADAGTDTGRAILNNIMDAAAEVLPRVDGTEGQFFTLAQFRDLRNHLAKDFAQAEPGTMNNAQRLAREAYDAMTGLSRETIASTYGAGVLDAYDKASKFWRNTSEIQDSPLGRALLQRQGGEAADSTIQSIASGMARGNVDELTKFKEFVGTIGEHNPEVGKLAIQTMQGALKNAFLTKHTKGGELDMAGLLGDLSSAAKYDKLPFPVQTLGFGDADTIRNWQAVTKKFKAEDINNPDVIQGVLANPLVQNVLRHGGSNAGEVLRKATAEEIFGKRLQEQVALEYAGKTKDARSLASEARRIATDANIAEADAQRILNRVKSDPVLSAFSGMGNYRLTQEAERVGEGTVSHLLERMPRQTAQNLMGSLKQRNPQLAEIVERRIVANEMKGFVKQSRDLPGGEGELDINALRAYFNPKDYENSRVRWLRNVVGDATVKKMESFTTKLAELSDAMRRGQLPVDRDVNTMAAVLGASTGAAGGIKPLQRVSFLNRLVTLANSGAYNALSWLVLDKDAAGKFYRATGPVSDVLTSMPTQKAYVLMLDKPLTTELAKINRPE